MAAHPEDRHVMGQGTESSATTSPADARRIAEAFVQARLAGRALGAYPGRVPADLEGGYACQDAAIALWPDRVIGWKVGYIASNRRDASGDDRLVGPIFGAMLRTAHPGTITEFPVFDGGFAAVEAEYVVRLGADAPPGKRDWTAGEAAALAGALHVGIETAGSPLATINQLGPTVVASDFGNNAGLILGPEIADWRGPALESLRCETWIDNRCVGRGGAAALEGGPMGALAFALARLARRGRPLRAGDLVSTGAATGIHDIRAGESARVDFGAAGTLHCRAVPMRGGAANAAC